MNRLQSLRRGPQTSRHPEPHRGDRPRAGDPRDRLRAPGLHPRRRRRAAPLGEISGRRPHPLLRRLLALGLPRGRRLVGAARRGDARRPRAVAAGPGGRCGERRSREPPEPSWRRLHERLRRSTRAGSRTAASVRSPTRSATGSSCRCFDLDELPELLDPIPLWSARRPAPARFRRDDYLPAAAAHADWPERARDLGSERARPPAGGARAAARQPALPRCRLQPRLVPLPATARRDELDSVIAEVTNTPWGERTAYVLDWTAPASRRAGHRQLREADARLARSSRWSRRYEISRGRPGREPAAWRSAISRAAARCSSPRWRCAAPSSPARECSRLLFRYPPMTLATLARIYANALRLRLKGATYHPHPRLAAD